MFSLLSSCLMWLPVIIVLFNVYTLSLSFRRALSPISWFSDEYLITSPAWKCLWGIYRNQHEACISERISETVCVSLVPGWGRVMLWVWGVRQSTLGLCLPAPAQWHPPPGLWLLHCQSFRMFAKYHLWFGIKHKTQFSGLSIIIFTTARSGANVSTIKHLAE